MPAGGEPLRGLALDAPAETSGPAQHPTDVPSPQRTWHWPEYLIEAWALGMFMVSAAGFTVLLEHPASPARALIDDPGVRRLLMGLAIGGTAIALIYSRLGARSGAHMNPATTLAFARLGRVAPRDAVAYILAQFSGALAGLAIASALLSAWIADPSVNYIVTRPGPLGNAVAFVGEAAISFGLMLVVLVVSNSRHARWTGLAAGVLLALYITIEAPWSGTSLNPARSFASALLSGSFQSLWIYFAAPVAGMAAAAEVYVRRRGTHAIMCARLNHAGTAHCIFRCRMRSTSAARAAA